MHALPHTPDVNSPATWISFQRRDAGADSIIFTLPAPAQATPNEDKERAALTQTPGNK